MKFEEKGVFSESQCVLNSKKQENFILLRAAIPGKAYEYISVDCGFSLIIEGSNQEEFR